MRAVEPIIESTEYGSMKIADRISGFPVGKTYTRIEGREAILFIQRMAKKKSQSETRIIHDLLNAKIIEEMEKEQSQVTE